MVMGSLPQKRLPEKDDPEDCVILELKSVERHDPIFEAQLLSYMKLTGKKVGLLINFNSKMVKDGIKRFAL